MSHYCTGKLVFCLLFPVVYIKISPLKLTQYPTVTLMKKVWNSTASMSMHYPFHHFIVLSSFRVRLLCSNKFHTMHFHHFYTINPQEKYHHFIRNDLISISSGVKWHKELGGSHTLLTLKLLFTKNELLICAIFSRCGS